MKCESISHDTTRRRSRVISHGLWGHLVLGRNGDWDTGGDGRWKPFHNNIGPSHGPSGEEVFRDPTVNSFWAHVRILQGRKPRFHGDRISVGELAARLNSLILA